MLRSAAAQVAERVLNGTFRAPNATRFWSLGWRDKAVALAELSVRVPKDVQRKLAHETARIFNGGSVFCGRMCSRQECLCKTLQCCIDEVQVSAKPWVPDFVRDHGVWVLPGDACEPGMEATWDIHAVRMQCAPCPPGTRAKNMALVSECRACPAGTYSVQGSTNCTPCPPGTANGLPAQGVCGVCSNNSIAPNFGADRCNLCMGSTVASEDRTFCQVLSPACLCPTPCFQPSSSALTRTLPSRCLCSSTSFPPNPRGKLCIILHNYATTNLTLVLWLALCLLVCVLRFVTAVCPFH